MRENSLHEIIGIIHDVRSVHNVGSMFRTADAAGITKIYLTGITPGPLDRFGKVRPDFKKVSLGAEASVEWEVASSLSGLIKKLKKDRYLVYAVEQAKNSLNIFRVAKKFHGKRVAFIVGNEVKGLSASILKATDYVFEIPMYGKKESLNVSVAFGIAAYAFCEAVHNKKL